MKSVGAKRSTRGTAGAPDRPSTAGAGRPPRRSMLRARVAIASAAWLLTACMQAQSPPLGLLDVTARPAERALLAGLKAYDDAQYDSADRLFRDALAAGLASPRDRAEAHKRLAFIHCAASRLGECEAEFKLARLADRSFALDKSEAGHPVWGPVYKKLQP